MDYSIVSFPSGGLQIDVSCDPSEQIIFDCHEMKRSWQSNGHQGRFTCLWDYGNNTLVVILSESIRTWHFYEDRGEVNRAISEYLGVESSAEYGQYSYSSKEYARFALPLHEEDIPQQFTLRAVSGFVGGIRGAVRCLAASGTKNVSLIWSKDRCCWRKAKAGLKMVEPTALSSDLASQAIRQGIIV